MNIHANATTCPNSRELLASRVIEQGWSYARAAEAAGVSKRTVAKWVARRRRGESMADRSSAPRRVPSRTPAQKVEAIERLRRLRMTAAEIAEILGIALRQRGVTTSTEELRSLATASAGFSGAELDAAISAASYRGAITVASVSGELAATVPLAHARAPEIAALRSRTVREVAADDYPVVLKVWSKRHRDLSRARNQVACRLHAVLCDLVPGGHSKEITAGQAARIGEQITPSGAVALARAELAAEFLEDMRRLDAQLRGTRKKLAAAVKVSGTTLTVEFSDGDTRVIRRTTTQPVRSIKGQRPRTATSVS